MTNETLKLGTEVNRKIESINKMIEFIDGFIENENKKSGYEKKIFIRCRYSDDNNVLKEELINDVYETISPEALIRIKEEEIEFLKRIQSLLSKNSKSLETFFKQL